MGVSLQHSVMRSVLLVVVGALYLAGDALAQSPVDQSKYEIIRETINFLATDKAVSKDTSFRITCETLDYDCFKQQLASDPVAGIERWYNAWRAMKVTDEAGLVALRKQVLADILERPGKGYRKQLAGYGAYVAKTESLLQPDVDEVPVDQVADMALESSDSAVGSQTIYPESAGPNDNPETENSMIAYLALVIGIAALVLVALPMLKKKEPTATADLQSIHARLDELAIRMRRLEQRTADGQLKEEVLTSLTEIMESVEKRVVELENRR